MQIVIQKERSPLGYDPAVKILHPGKKDLEIRATVLNRVGNASSDPMREVNAYLATLSEDRQLALYDLYRVLSQERGKISHVAREIGQWVQVAEVQKWVATCLEKPHGIPYVFDVKLFPTGTAEDRVYLQDQYTELQALGIVVKLLFPVMALFGNNDFNATGVLRMAGVHEFPAYRRLKRFIEASVHAQEPKSSKAIAPKVFDCVLYRRLPIADLEAFEQGFPSLVAFLYSYAMQKARSFALSMDDHNSVGQ